MSAIQRAINLLEHKIEKSFSSVQEDKDKLDLLVELMLIKKHRLDGEKLTRKDVEKCLSLLCWNSLAGCCSPVKECVWHQIVCEALGFKPEDVWEAKETGLKGLKQNAE